MRINRTTFRQHFKRNLLVASIILTSLSVGIVRAVQQPETTGAQTSPIVQQVDHNTQQLENHEGRITNTENDVKDLQTKTNTPPSASRTTIKEVTTPSANAPISESPPASASPAPIAITVVRSGYLAPGTIPGHEGDCLLYYSDGSEDFVKATVITTHDGGTTSTADNCASFVGQTK